METGVARRAWPQTSSPGSATGTFSVNTGHFEPSPGILRDMSGVQLRHGRSSARPGRFAGRLAQRPYRFRRKCGPSPPTHYLLGIPDVAWRVNHEFRLLPVLLGVSRGILVQRAMERTRPITYTRAGAGVLCSKNGRSGRASHRYTEPNYALHPAASRPSPHRSNRPGQADRTN